MGITLKTGAAFTLDLANYTFNFDEVTPANIDSFSSTKIIGSDDDGFKFVIRGSGFTHNKQGAVTGGEINSIVESVNGMKAADISGLHLSVKEAFAVFNTPSHADDAKLLQSILSGNDSLSGGKQADKIYGYNGNDKLYGSSGDDHLYGGKGNDMLNGGTGINVLTGGAGKDTFVFVGGHHDQVTDFAHGDRINLRNIDAVVGGGHNAFDFIGTDAFSGNGGELRYEIKGSDTFIYCDTDADSKPEVIIQLDSAVDLTKADFIL